MSAAKSLRGKRVQVTFSEEQRKILEELRGATGAEDAEIVRSIVLMRLSEKSLLSGAVKKEA